VFILDKDKPKSQTKQICLDVVLKLFGFSYKMDKNLEQFKANLGKRIKTLREERGLTQPELGALIDKDYQVLGRIENGRVNPSSFIVYQIALALKVTMGEVFDFSELRQK